MRSRKDRRNRLADGSWLAIAAGLTGVAAGAGGIVLALLLHAVQHLALGYTEAAFLAGVERAAPSRRVVAMAIGGLIVGVGWWALRRWCTPVPSIGQALSDPDRALPLGLLTTDAALQIVAVGAGASLGREGAPRQLGAALAHLIATRPRLTLDPPIRV